MITYDNKSLIKDGKRWFPIMGEMHYSRCDRVNWERSLKRMKSGGIDIVSSYVIWIHHEEEEGIYDFTGNKDLHSFLIKVKESGLLFCLRIGPWIHAEVRNGGFPDWLLKKDFVPRTNDLKYLEEVKKYYKKIYSEVKDMFYPNGPIIGVQIENEYGHCGGLNGEDGEEHMKSLTKIAKEIGYNPYLFTATGWGGAVCGGLLPVMGAYCDAPWDFEIAKLPPNPNYLISYERNDKNIGSDMGLGYGLTFDQNMYPYLMAELGGGLQPTSHRRVFASSLDTGAMTLCKLAGGCNLLGYYMYHGGSNPIGKFSTFEENKETGSLNNMPKINYDGRSALRQYGQFGEVYKEIKLFASFIKEFGQQLCDYETIIPKDNAVHADDFKTLRYSIRLKDNSGFLFICNYIRGYDLPKKYLKEVTINNYQIQVNMEINQGEYGIYPINMQLNNNVLEFANVTPLFNLNNKDYVFYTTSNREPILKMQKKYEGEILVLDRISALNANKVLLDKEYLVLTEGYLESCSLSKLVYVGSKALSVSLFPDFTNNVINWKKEKKGKFTIYDHTIVSKEPTTKINMIKNKDGLLCEIEVDYQETLASQILLNIYYSGNRAELYVNDILVNDDFCINDCWQIDLVSIRRPKKLDIQIYQLNEDDEIYFEKPIKFKDKVSCEIKKVELTCLYTHYMEVL